MTTTASTTHSTATPTTARPILSRTTAANTALQLKTALMDKELNKLCLLNTLNMEDQRLTDRGINLARMTFITFYTCEELTRNHFLTNNTIQFRASISPHKSAVIKT